MNKDLNMSAAELAKFFDHTLLRADASVNDFGILCEESRKYGFKMVAINPAAVKLCKRFLEGSGVLVGAAIGFPLGQNTIETKLYETQDAIANGSDEIDYVINIAELKNAGMTKDYSYITIEMEQIVNECKKNNVTSKVIFENCYLTEEEKRILCNIALEVGPDFIKTSTGFGTSGAKAEDVRLMKSIVGDRLRVKASGGVRTLDDALEMIRAGASRIGSSSSVRIVEAYINQGADIQ